MRVTLPPNWEVQSYPKALTRQSISIGGRQHVSLEARHSIGHRSGGYATGYGSNYTDSPVGTQIDHARRPEWLARKIDRSLAMKDGRHQRADADTSLGCTSEHRKMNYREVRSRMPLYKNRPDSRPDEEVWHYTTLEAVHAILIKGELRLTRVDTWPDPFEGSVPKQDIDNQIPLFSSVNQSEMTAFFPGFSSYHGASHAPRRDPDPWQTMTARRLAKRRSAHASCWRLGNDSEAMWRLYCRPDGIGVALRTTLKNLEASVETHDLYVSPVRYIDYRTASSFTDEMDVFFHKRLGFDHEREVRLLHFNSEYYNQLNAQISGGVIDVLPDDLPGHRFLAWSLRNFVDEIVVSPYASEDYEKLVRHSLTADYTALAARIALSELNPRRYSPQF